MRCVPIYTAVLLFASLARAADAPKAEPFADNACVQCHRDLPG